MSPKLTAPLIAALLALGLYASAYAILRLTHVLTHSSLWTSQEGLYGHHVHAVEGPQSLTFLFTPLITVEKSLQQRHQP